ncbi:MAG: galactosyltransferase-related protein [Jaaginema sp. PMC 1079.18]|nr:galactosyltransferase-related protein [Jaaginema sp. PMC 1080.18]MEC4850607.1 galactosyltransferase-related protein [Jaaginema sp. PMC 1079.18]MEC4867717.1 galactosyltransferase-related protein [Jaaginema sp. PMC 1078.18]
MQLSLLTVYRDRAIHLHTQLAWWQQQAQHLTHCEWIIIEADKTPSPGLKKSLENQGIKYQFLENSGTLHKTKALNLGIQIAQGDYITPFDVDLIPLKNTLQQHLKLAQISPQLLITGYRVMSPLPSLNLSEIEATLEQCEIAPEDKPSALSKHLLKAERFGVLPFFQRQRILEINGWDEEFIGWGAEDQDLIERYLEDFAFLCRSPHLVYLHLHHGKDKHWHEDQNITSNRHKYYQKRQIKAQ